MNVFKIYFTIFKTSFMEWQDDNASLLSAAISYFTVFSIVPFLILMTMVAGQFIDSTTAQEELFRQIQTVYSTRAAKAVQSIFLSSNQMETGFASLFSLALLLYLGSKVFFQLQQALNVIWKTAPKKDSVKNFFIKRAFSFLMLFSVGGFIVLFFLADAALKFFRGTIPDTLPVFQKVFLLEIFSQSISFLLFSLLFAFSYRYIPDRKVQWRDVWLGSLVTAIIFGVGRYLFTLYFGKIDLTSTYGAAGSIIIILVWVYFSSHIFLYGAKFTYVYARKLGSLRQMRDKKPGGR